MIDEFVKKLLKKIYKTAIEVSILSKLVLNQIDVQSRI